MVLVTEVSCAWYYVTVEMLQPSDAKSLLASQTDHVIAEVSAS